MTQQGNYKILKGDEIDLLALVKTLWEGRKRIVYSAVIGLIIGLLIAFISPVKYSVSATLLPTSDKKGGSLGNLGALAGMAGINLNSMMGDANGIPIELYPQVVKSVPYLKELIYVKMTWEKYPEPLSLYDVVVKDSVPDLMTNFLNYTIKLPWTIKNAITARSNSSEVKFNDNISMTNVEYLVLTKHERHAIEKLSDAIGLNYDKKNGLVTLSVTMHEPLLTAQLADNALQLLQRHIIEYKTKHSTSNLLFIQELHAEAKAKYEKAQQELFNYRDSHRHVVTERMDIEYQRLSDAYDISSVTYKGLSQQLEQAKITVKNDTPVFKVLDPAIVPADKSGPKRGLIIIIGTFVGLIMGVLFIFSILIVNNMREKFLHHN